MGTAQGREGAGHQAGPRAGVPAQADRSRLGGQASELPRGGVDLIEHGRGAAQHDVSCGGRPHPVVAPFQQRRPCRPFQRGDLPGDRRLGVTQRGRCGGEGAPLGHLAEDPQRHQRHVGEIHDYYAYHICVTFVLTHDPDLLSVMAMSDARIALVTGANQGLGFALVTGLAARMNRRTWSCLPGVPPGASPTPLPPSPRAPGPGAG